MRSETEILILALPPVGYVTFNDYHGFLIFTMKEREGGWLNLISQFFSLGKDGLKSQSMWAY